MHVEQDHVIVRSQAQQCRTKWRGRFEIERHPSEHEELGFTLLRAMRSDEPNTWVSVVFVTCFAVLVWLVAMVLSRGTWRPRDDSIVAYIDLSIHRCRSVIVAAPVGIVLYVAGLIGSLAWRQRLLGVEWQQCLERTSTNRSIGLTVSLSEFTVMAAQSVHDIDQFG